MSGDIYVSPCGTAAFDWREVAAIGGNTWTVVTLRGAEWPDGPFQRRSEVSFEGKPADTIAAWQRWLAAQDNGAMR